MKRIIEYTDLRGDGRIMLYRRTGSPNYHVRVRVRGCNGYLIKSTNSPNLRESERFGEDLYEEMYFRIRRGGDFNSPTYQKIFNEWKKYRLNSGTTSKGGSWVNTVKNVEEYSIQYFGKMKIDKISTQDFSKYWEWRKHNYKLKEPSNGSLVRERTSILNLINFCVERGHLTKIIDIPKPQVDMFRRRSTFTEGEYKKITRLLREWVKDGKVLGKWRDRYIFQQYFLILSNSGLRVGELRHLKWDDVKPKKRPDDPLVVEVKGKTGKRQVVFNKGSDEYVRRLFDLRTKHLGSTPPLNEVIFVNYSTNKPFTSMKNSFMSLMKFCNIPLEKDGINRTLYSLRHFYITMRLSQDVSIHLLSKNVGSSIDMLERFYSHIITSDVSEQITKTTRTIRKKESHPTTYPWITYEKQKQIEYKVE